MSGLIISKLTSKGVLGTAVLVALVAAGFFIWKAHANKPAAVSVSSSTSAKISSADSSPKQQTSQPSPNTSNQVTLLAPTGNFVNNHNPSLNPSSTLNQMSSVCVTTVSAQCTVSFTMNGVTKSLPAKTTDTNGTASWYWRPQDIGLTTGSWKIVATASLGGQSKSTTDALMLDIRQ